MPPAAHNRLQTLSLIVFCYNEAGNIQNLLHRAVAMPGRAKNNLEIIVVDDGSSDDTFNLASEFKNKHKHLFSFKLVKHQHNIGIGAALKSGYALAQMENVCAVPGDGQFDLAELEANANISDNTIVSFYRRGNLQYSIFRNYLSLINKKINAYFLGINMKDVNWVKIYKRKDLHSLDLRLKSSLVESEICSKLLHKDAKLVEVESKYLQRQHGVSKGASPKIIWQAARDTFALIRELQRFRKDLKKR